MPYLKAITENDYREYRRSFSKVQYSYKSNEEDFLLPIGILNETTKNVILGKGDFLDIVQNPHNSLFFYKNDSDETIGIVFLYFKNKTCKIAEFSVFEHGKGNGSKLFKEVENVCREKGIYDIELWCPFNGAKKFWEKEGFYENKPTYFYHRISKHK